jgi:hypothetical protein
VYVFAGGGGSRSGWLPALCSVSRAVPVSLDPMGAWAVQKQANPTLIEQLRKAGAQNNGAGSGVPREHGVVSVQVYRRRWEPPLFAVNPRSLRQRRGPGEIVTKFISFWHCYGPSRRVYFSIFFIFYYLWPLKRRLVLHL